MIINDNYHTMMFSAKYIHPFLLPKFLKIIWMISFKPTFQTMFEIFIAGPHVLWKIIVTHGGISFLYISI